MLQGEVDFVLKCVAKDLSSFQSFITETLTAAKNVAGVPHRAGHPRQQAGTRRADRSEVRAALLQRAQHVGIVVGP